MLSAAQDVTKYKEDAETSLRCMCNERASGFAGMYLFLSVLLPWIVNDWFDGNYPESLIIVGIVFGVIYLIVAVMACMFATSEYYKADKARRQIKSIINKNEHYKDSSVSIV